MQPGQEPPDGKVIHLRRTWNPSVGLPLLQIFQELLKIHPVIPQGMSRRVALYLQVGQVCLDSRSHRSPKKAIGQPPSHPGGTSNRPTHSKSTSERPKDQAKRLFHGCMPGRVARTRTVPYPLMGDSLKALVPGRPTTGQFAADDCDQRLTHVHGIHHVTVTATA